MPLTLVTVPCLSDNYAFLLNDSDTGATLLVDIPEAEPIIAMLQQRGWSLTDILITHHHHDHIQGLAGVVAHDAYLRVTGAAADAHRLPPLSRAVSDGDTFVFSGHTIHVLDVSGHTLGHLAYYIPDAGAVFTGDSLMALGCGRLFEGDAPTMWASLQKLAALPPETLVCSGHEYTAKNAEFALSVESDNAELIARAARIAADRAEWHPTVPSVLSDELATNPFLRVYLPKVKETLSLTGHSDAEVFAALRARKDRF